MSETSNHGWNIPVVGGNENEWGEILNTLFENMDDQIILDGLLSERPDASTTSLVYYHATDESIIYYNEDGTWIEITGASDGTGEGVDNLNYISGHTAWEPGISEEEIHRFTIPTGEVFNLSSLELREKGGGAEITECNMDVYDASSATVLASTSLNDKTVVSDISSSEGAILLFRFTNETDSTIDASITVRGNIE